MAAKKTKKRAAGRRSLLEDPIKKARVDEFLERVETGMSVIGAARVAGISETAVYEWEKKAGEKDARAHYREFAERLNRAKGLREQAHIEAIRDASIQTKDGTLPDWRAHAWLLERLEHNSYGKRQVVEMSGGMKLKLDREVVIVNMPERDVEFPDVVTDIEKKVADADARASEGWSGESED